MSSDDRLIQAAEGYLELGLHRQAVESLERISEGGRAAHPFHFHLYFATALQFCGRFADAIPHFLAAQKEKPAEIACYLGLGWCYKRVARIELAIESLHEAQRVCRVANDDQNLPLVLYNLSCYHSLAGRKEDMLKNLAAALELDPAYRDRIPQEPDFDPFRDDPDFLLLASPDA